MFQGLFNFATQAAQEFARVVTEFRQRERVGDDRYVTGGTHWDGFSHKSLFKMVWENADPVHVERLADTWSRQGESITQRSEDLQRSLAKLMQYWSGGAADEAAETVLRNAAWLADLGATASSMAAPIEHAAGALRSAQQQMPAPPEGFSWGSIAGAAAAGAAFGGPIGAGIGAVIGGIGSMFGGSSKKKKLKRRAVQTMQRFETAAIDVDGSTPGFTGPATGGGGGGTGPYAPPRDDLGSYRPPGDLTGGGGGTAGATRTSGNDVTIPSFVGGGGGADARWNALTGGPGGAGFDASKLGLGGGRAGGAGMAGGLPLAGMPFGPFGQGGRDLLRNSRFGAAGMAGGPLAGGRRGQGDEDAEHQRKYSIEEDPFALDKKAAPPVIGL